MKAWLLTWNKERWAWDDYLDGYEALLENIKQTGKVYAHWSCGQNKSIQPGDRVFLIKLGSDPRGIIASGYADTGVYETNHWDPAKHVAGLKAKRIYLHFDKMADYRKDRYLTMNQLKTLAPNFCWSSQASGIQIDPEVLVKLERVWRQTVR